MRRIAMRMGKDPFRCMSLRRSEEIDVVGTNAGNMLFAQAAFKTLSAPGVAIERQGYVAPGRTREADRLNERCDALVLPLANAFRAQWAERLDEYAAFISRLKIPVIVLGVGAQANLDYGFEKLAGIEAPAKRFMAAVLDRSAKVGVRGECTAAFLKRLGFGADVVEVIGCPSMYQHGERLAIDEAKSRALHERSALSINVVAGEAGRGFRSALDVMIDIADRHLRRFPNSILIPQETRSLSTMLHGERLGRGLEYDGVSAESRRALAGGRARFFVDANSWYDALARVDFSFGPRLHGNIAALLGGTPAVMLAIDSRTRELGEYHGIPWRRITEVDADLDAARLAAEADYSRLLGGHRERFENYLRFVRNSGLPCIYDTPGAADAFDARLAEARRAPPAVGVAGDRPTRYRLHKIKRRVVGRLERAVPALARR